MSKEYEALHAKNGSRTEFYRLELLDKFGIKKADMELLEGSVSVNSEAEVKRVAQVVARTKEMQIDFTSDRLKVVMGIVLEGDRIKEYSLGVFVITMAKEYYIQNELFYKIDGMDESTIMQQAFTREPKLFLAGTLYSEVLQYLIISCGITKIDMSVQPVNDTGIVNDNHKQRIKLATFNTESATKSSLTLKSDLVIDGSMSKLEWFNHLAEQSGYDRLSVNGEGYFVIKRYIEPSPANVMHTYTDDYLSVILPERESMIDIWKIPNVFILTVSHPDIGELTSTFINNDPSNKLSVIKRGFEIVSMEIVDNIASQDELDALARKRAFNASQVTQEVVFNTLNMPKHNISDVLSISANGIDGVFVEKFHKMQLKAGGIMQHTAKRLVRIQ